VDILTITDAVSGRAVSEAQWIDVRSPSEYSTGHIPGTVNIPMDQIEARLDDLIPHRSIVLVCQAGKRARMVAGLIAPCRSDVMVLEGGAAAWSKAGLPLVVSSKTRWSLERQVRLSAGLLLLVALILAVLVSRYWLCLGAFVGAGLTFAGLTDMCPMGSLLAHMPWNRKPCAPAQDAKQPCAM